MKLNRSVFMIKKLWRDLKSRSITIPIYQGQMTQELRAYYILFESDFKKLNRLLTAFDDDGVPLNSSYIDVEDVGLHYYPISIGQFGLALFHDYLKTEKQASKEHFLRIADWFYNSAILDDKLGAYWLTAVPKPEFSITEPWKSAFSQSRGISMLLRAWQLTNDKKYLDLATLALQPFVIDTSAGGVSVSRKEQETFYEEYVAAQPTRVLDGHSFSLFGLYDFVRAVTPDIDPEAHQLAKRLFDDGVTGLLNTIDRFDTGSWLLYTRCEIPHFPKNDPCTIGYMKLVTAQFDILYSITKEEKFKQYSAKFQSYLNWSNIFKMYKTKFGALKKLGRL